jgi:hypothetical protein
MASTICAIRMLNGCAVCAVTLTAIVTTTLLTETEMWSTPMATISPDSLLGEANGELVMLIIQLIRMESRNFVFSFSFVYRK